MTSQDVLPLTAADLDINPEGLPFPADAALRPLAGGFNSWVFEAGSYVVKVSKSLTSSERALRLTQTMHDEYRRIAEFVDDYLPPTTYRTMPSTSRQRKHRVVIIQDFISGPPLPDYLRRPHAQTDELAAFFELCLRMHHQTGLIPDLANVQTAFDPLLNTNVVMSPNEKDGVKPFLADTSFGKIQRSRALGPLWSMAIAQGVQRSLTRLG
jgi:hypothetical protein